MLIRCTKLTFGKEICTNENTVILASSFVQIIATAGIITFVFAPLPISPPTALWLALDKGSKRGSMDWERQDKEE